MSEHTNGHVGKGYVTVASFPHPADAVFVEAELRERDIPYLLLDANTVQTAPYYSAAIGGVRLQVPEQRAEEVVALLRELGVPQEPHQILPKWMAWFDGIGQRLPWVRHRSPFGRMAVLMGAALFVLLTTAVVIGLRHRPTIDLASTTWWVELIEHDGAPWEPSQPTNRMLFVQMTGVLGQITFRADDRVQFPCTTAGDLTAHWYLDDDMLVIHDADTLQHIYEGVYDVFVSSNELILRSPRTLIRSRAHMIQFQPPRF